MLQQIAIECDEIKNNFDLKRYYGWKETATALGFSHNMRTNSEMYDIDPDFSDIHQYDSEEVFNSFLNNIFNRKEMGIINPKM